jgi:hypothetical protein
MGPDRDGAAPRDRSGARHIADHVAPCPRLRASRRTAHARGRRPAVPQETRQPTATTRPARGSPALSSAGARRTPPPKPPHARAHRRKTPPPTAPPHGAKHVLLADQQHARARAFNRPHAARHTPPRPWPASRHPAPRAADQTVATGLPACISAPNKPRPPLPAPRHWRPASSEMSCWPSGARPHAAPHPSPAAPALALFPRGKPAARAVNIA